MKRLKTFACTFALLACYVGCVTPAFAEGAHPWLKLVSIAIGPVNYVADEDPELAATLKKNVRQTFEIIYKDTDPPINVVKVAEPVYVECEDLTEPARFLKKTQDFILLGAGPVDFIAVAELSNTQGWGLVYVANVEQGRAYILIADLEKEAPDEQRS